MSETPILESQNTTKIFKIGGGLGLVRRRIVKAVEDVSFSVPGDKPNIMALVGESGSGKTTLARMILALIGPTSGKILYKGDDIYSLLKEDWRSYRRAVQPIFQDPYGIYNPFYRVERVLEIAVKKFHLASNEREGRRLIVEAMEGIGLRPQDILGRYPHQLSGGERQRLMLARILLMKPNLIIADEPVSMIDASLRASFLDTLTEFRDRFDISCLYITHDLNIAFHTAERIVILCYGRVVESGEMESVIRDPLHPYTQILVKSIPTPDPKKRWGEKLEVGEAALSELRVEKGCVFHNRCPYVTPICRGEMPALMMAKQGREVACYLYQERA